MFPSQLGGGDDDELMGAFSTGSEFSQLDEHGKICLIFGYLKKRGFSFFNLHWIFQEFILINKKTN
jgi:hypothetical protein